MAVKRKRDVFETSTTVPSNHQIHATPVKASVSQHLHNAKNQNGREGVGSLSRRKLQLLELRKRLPIWSHSSEIKEGLRGEKDVMILTGETGSGKSTQVPQFLVNEPWCKGCIAITQPRRVAATSLARRVAEEMGTPLGSSSPSSRVGYSVRFDSSTSPSTKIKFLTEGMLLQEMLRDPWLNQYSAVIVDEVHERGVNVDLILGFLRKIVTSNKDGRKGNPLKTIVMSATAETDALYDFFAEGYGTIDPPIQAIENTDKSSVINKKSVASRNEPVTQVNQKAKDTAQDTAQKSASDTMKLSRRISTVYVKGRQYPVDVVYAPSPVDDFPEAALKAIFQIHYKEPLPGDILVFLTGQDVVESVEAMVNEQAAGLDKAVPKILALPLFAALPAAAQQEVFTPTPARTRKVILATNIAETSVTIPGVRFVVDCGLAKVKEYRTQLGLDSLLVKPISKSAANQRKGRAGREAPGKCHRLYTEKDYLQLAAANVPEVLRCDLSQSILIMKARGINDVLNFPLINRPKPDSMRQALLHLHRLRALTDHGSISEFGQRMARFPLSPALACVLIRSQETGDVLDMVDLIASLTVENIFLNITSEEDKENAEAARRELHRREGDHMTLLSTVKAYAAEQSDRKSWAKRHFVSHRAMRSVMDVRKQLRVQCQQQKLLPSSFDDESPGTSSVAYSPEKAATLLKCLMSGFAANVARLMPDGSYKTIEGNQAVTIHPSSVLFGRKVEAILYNELIFTTKCYARAVSAVQLNWYAEAVAKSETL